MKVDSARVMTVAGSAPRATSSPPRDALRGVGAKPAPPVADRRPEVARPAIRRLAVLGSCW